MDVGPAELLIILVVVLLVFGGAKLPQLARSLGQAKNEFEKGLRDGSSPSRDAQGVTLTRAELNDLLQDPTRGARTDRPPTPSQ